MAVELGLGGSSRRLNFCDVLLVILAWTRHANCRALAQLPIYVHGISWISGKGASSKGKGVAKSADKGAGPSRSRSRSPPALDKGKGKSKDKGSPPIRPIYVLPIVGSDRSALDDILDGMADWTSEE